MGSRFYFDVVLDIVLDRAQVISKCNVSSGTVQCTYIFLCCIEVSSVQ